MTKIAIKNSFILNLILFIPDIIQIGVINAVSKINNTEIPSTPNLDNLSDTMFKNHLEQKLKVLKPFTNEELKYLKEHQDGLTCEYTECYNRNLTSMDLYDSERKKIFQIIELV